MGLLSRLSGKKKVMSEDETKQMQGDAKNLVAMPAMGKTCPVCGNASIYTEPIAPATARPALWSFMLLTRKPRFVCLNPGCDASYQKTKTRFTVNSIGDLVMTHPFSQVCKENPFRVHL